MGQDCEAHTMAKWMQGSLNRGMRISRSIVYKSTSEPQGIWRATPDLLLPHLRSILESPV